MVKKLRSRFYFLERIVKGFSNHRRLEILNLLNEKEELSTEDICDVLDINYKTANEHLRRLVISGLVWKRREGLFTHYRLSPLGKTVLIFLRKLEKKIKR